MTDYLEIYNKGREVPKEAQKAFNNGKFSGTDINPMWRIKKLTEIFGPAGIGWYTEILSERCEEHGDSDTIAIVDLNLYVKVDGEWSKPIYGTGGNVIKRMTKYQKLDVSDEGYKMAYTDALSVACKALGIGADIYFSQDKTKYTRPESVSATPAPRAPQPAAKKEPEDVPFTFDESPAEAVQTPAVLCADCGRLITGNKKMSAEEAVRRTTSKFGVPLCIACGNKRYENREGQ